MCFFVKNVRSQSILSGLLALASVVTLSAEDIPFEVRTLTSQRDAKIKQINEVYKNELLKLQKKYMQDADLDSAKAVDNIIKSLDPSSGETPAKLPTTAEELSSFLTGSSWGPRGRKPTDGLIFESDGTFKWEKSTYHYSVTGPKTINLIWGGGTSIKCEFSEDFSSFSETEGLKKKWNSLGRIE